MISFTVPGIPAPKGSMRAIRTRKGKVAMKHDNARTEPWSLAVSWRAKQAMGPRPPIAGPVMLRVHFDMPRPKTVKREHPTAKPDVDKLLRAVLDAGTGILWRDDAQVVSVMGRKRYADDVNGPHAHVIVMALDPDEQQRAEDGTPATRIELEDL